MGQVDEIFLHGGKNAVTRGLRGGQADKRKLRGRKRGVGENGNRCGSEAEPGAHEKIAHGGDVVEGSIEVFKNGKIAAAARAAGGMLGRGLRRLIGVDANQQSAAHLCDRPLSGDEKKERAGGQESKAYQIDAPIGWTEVYWRGRGREKRFLVTRAVTHKATKMANWFSWLTKRRGADPKVHAGESKAIEF